MGFSLIAVFILSAFTATGYSLSCIHCSSIDGSPCVGSSRICSTAENACVSLVTRTATGATKPYTLFSRHCGKSDICGKPLSLSHPQGFLKNNQTCCYTDGCTSSTPTIPPDSTEKNGVTCRGCYSATSGNCTDIAMDCTGDETQCFKVVTTISGNINSKSIQQGCASKETCKFGDQPQITVATGVVIEVSCSNGNSRLQDCPILLYIVAFLLLKHLY